MENRSCTGPGVTDRCLTQSRKSGANVKIRSGIRGEQLAFTLVTLLWIFQCQAREVAAQPLPFTAAPPPAAENGSVPAGGPEVPLVGQAPQESAPPTQPAGQLLQFQEVLSSLNFNNYSTAAQYLSDSLFLFPLGSTLFVPTNAAFQGLSPSPSVGGLLAYHIILQQLSYQEITLLPVGARFITMIINNTIMVTSVAPDDFRVDNVRVIQGNVCSSTALALNTTCHGVDGILNMTEWGRANLAQVAPFPSPKSDAPVSELAPPTVLALPPAPTPAPAGGISPSGGASRIERRFPLFSVVFLYVFALAL